MINLSSGDNRMDYIHLKYKLDKKIKRIMSTIIFKD
jgi:hypothetical protein